MRYAWIKDHHALWPVRMLCRVLEVAPSGYYQWQKRQPTKRELNNTFLDQKIQEIYAFHQRRYGYRRIHRDLRAVGVHCSARRVRSRMRQLGLQGKGKRKFKATTDSAHSLPVAANLLNRDFSTTGINQKWVGDITYVPTGQGWLYLAVVIDLHSRTVIGWAMSKRITRHLVCDALKMALQKRGFPRGVIVHTDQGSQYCSKDYQRLLRCFGLICSMSRKGNCWDNAPAESFFRTLKVELIHGKNFEDRGEAKTVIFEYIEGYYNRARRHSALDYLTPYEVECEVLMAA